ncbi:MAG: pyruvate dehydrogenase (acetyl-transferring) E1 component subunit alpha, partial [Proteobacteria bacterium]|nr:pyruvate dehydrogenase (acetyl-transferring) E1 component subunit alpha [Pseudomonadota bacterium]
DPIERFKKHLQKEGILTTELEEKIKKDVTKLIDEAVQFGQDAPLPRPEDALEDLFVNP